MIRNFFTLMVLPLTVSPLWGQSIVLPERVEGKPGRPLVIRPITLEADAVAWLPMTEGLDLLPPEVLISDKLCVAFADVGSYKLGAIAVKCISGKAKISPLAVCQVVVGTPTPPVPPDPIPGPAPIPVKGLHVLIVYESAELSKLSPVQQAILFNKDMREYLNTTCPVGPDGKTREWRIWDKDVDASAESELWQAALKRDRKSVPWIIVSNPDKGGGYEGPLPATITETMALLKKYGG
jgi:hypothetical protein